MNYDITVIRSKRKSLSLEIKNDGRIFVRVPLRMKDKEIEKFVSGKRRWLDSKLKKLGELREKTAGLSPLTDEEIKELNEKAGEYIPRRVDYYSKLIGVSFGRIRIGILRSRWGSCSKDGNLSFNSLLMLAPPETVDSVIVHELCHRLEMNHSKAFYSHVLRAFPDYKKHNKWLKDNGIAIMSRLPEK